jgi:hypothetical protein
MTFAGVGDAPAGAAAPGIGRPSAATVYLA